MNHAFEIKSDESIEIAPPEDLMDAARLHHHAMRLDDELIAAECEGDVSKAEELRLVSERIWDRLRASECGRAYLEQMRSFEAPANSEHVRADFDGLVAEALGELSNEAPEAVMDMMSKSLQRSAAIMLEIVEETRSDLLDVERRRKEIDRKQTETRAILNEAMARFR